MEASPEMQQRIMSTRAELQAVKARIAAAKQTKRMLELTNRQIEQEKTKDQVWQGVGRMFIKASTSDFEKDVETRQKELDGQLSALDKKELYYKTTLDKMIQAVTGQ